MMIVCWLYVPTSTPCSGSGSGSGSDCGGARLPRSCLCLALALTLPPAAAAAESCAIISSNTALALTPSRTTRAASSTHDDSGPSGSGSSAPAAAPATPAPATPAAPAAPAAAPRVVRELFFFQLSSTCSDAAAGKRFSMLWFWRRPCSQRCLARSSAVQSAASRASVSTPSASSRRIMPTLHLLNI
jgi:hypothetical protein